MSVDISFGEFSYKGEQRSKTEPREGCGVKEGFLFICLFCNVYLFICCIRS